MTLIPLFRRRGKRELRCHTRRTELWLYLPEEHRPPESICAMGERHGSARNVPYFRAVDGGGFRGDVGRARR